MLRAYRVRVAIFADRADAGRQLAAALEEHRGADAVVFGIPRGGVVVAAEVARALALPLAAAVVRKLGAPAHEEYAIGAIAEGVEVVNADAVRQRRRHAGGSSRASKTSSAPNSTGGRGCSRHLASPDRRTHGHRRRRRRRDRCDGDGGVPVAARRRARHGSCSPFRWLRPRGSPPPDAVDEYVCPHPIRDFWAVGQFYTDFTQTTDEEVIATAAARSTGSASEEHPER